ncbi:MAG: hypothetical protein WEB57_08520 [Pseudohongiellaceae bacterium]
MNHLQQYENTRHVLDEIRSFHQRLAGLYGALAEQATEARAEMLLNYMKSREEAQGAVIDLYESDAPASILDSWFQVPYPENLNDFLKLLEIRSDLNVEQARELIMEADEFLMALLNHVERRVINPEVKAVFQDLQELEREEEKALTRAVNSFWEF